MSVDETFARPKLGRGFPDAMQSARVAALSARPKLARGFADAMQSARVAAHSALA